MFETIQSYLKFGNSYCGLEQTDNAVYGLLLKRSKGELTIEKELKGKSIVDIADEVTKNQHAVLTINTDKVLTKEIESIASSSQNALLNAAFPNLQINDFFYGFIETPTKTIISICRKEIVTDILETYLNLGISIIDFHIGPTIIQSLFPFFSGELTMNGYSVSVDSSQLRNLQKTEPVEVNSYTINGLSISSTSMLSFAGGLSSVTQNDPPSSGHSKKSISLLSDYLNDRFFFLFSRFAVVFFLIGLLINFLFFSHYFDEVNRLKEQAETNVANKTKLIELNERVDQKKQLADNLLTAASSYSSRKMNDLISVLPLSVILDEVNVHPLTKAIKTKEEIKVDNHSVFISGKSSNKTDFTQWISQLESLPWVDNVLISSYEEGTKNANFSISIKVSDQKK